MRALVLEDDERLRSLVVRTLTRAGLACDEAARIAEAEELLGLHDYDLLVLDRRLPDGDGLDVCRRARARGFRHSILMLTAMDQRRGRDRGPLRGRRRLPRQALRPRGPRGPRPGAAAPQRGAGPAGARRPATCGSIPGRRAAWRGAETLALTAREFTILELLMRSPGAVVSREEILEQAWGEREEPMSNTIDVLVGRLRRKLDRPRQPSRIETVRGMGYRLR